MALRVHAFKRIDQSLVPYPELKGTPHQYIQPELGRLNVSRNNTKVYFFLATRLAPWHALQWRSYPTPAAKTNGQPKTMKAIPPPEK